MSWFQRLYETYENCVTASESDKYEIAPIGHTHKVCNIEITLDEKAEMVGARVIKEDTIIPTTDDDSCLYSLAVKIENFKKDQYRQKLKEWIDFNKSFDKSNEKLNIISNYVQRDTLIPDLEEKGICRNGKFIEKLENKKQEDAFIRWIVVVGTDKNRNTWEDKSIIESWIKFRKAKLKNGTCYITGNNTICANGHPKVNGTAKLLSSEDDKNFIFNGRFVKQNEALNIGFEVSQKAHNTLKWLVAKKRGQAYHNDSQIIVAFTVNGKGGNIGEVFGKDFVKGIMGYSIDFEQFEQNENIVLLEMDAASPGRACITYYKELLGSQYLENIKNWYAKYYWQQFLEIKNKDNQRGEYQYFYGTPSINTIANAYLYTKNKKYLDRIEDKEKKIKKKLIRDLMPSVLEDKNIPEYIEKHFVEKASNPVALNNGQWKTILRIACSIYKGNNLYDKNKKEEDYLMSIYENEQDRNYLYGRLLAVIDDAEKSALLKQNKENSNTKETIRLTNAQRLMRQFSIKPFETWKFLYEKFNDAYKKRLNGYWIDKKIVDIKDKFTSVEEFENNSKLTGLYLLGYFHQLKAIEDEREAAIQNKKAKEFSNDTVK